VVKFRSPKGMGRGSTLVGLGEGPIKRVHPGDQSLEQRDFTVSDAEDEISSPDNVTLPSILDGQSLPSNGLPVFHHSSRTRCLLASRRSTEFQGKLQSVEINMTLFGWLRPGFS
jgi:hypothetical protein